MAEVGQVQPHCPATAKAISQNIEGGRGKYENNSERKTSQADGESAGEWRESFSRSKEEEMFRLAETFDKHNYRWRLFLLKLTPKK